MANSSSVKETKKEQGVGAPAVKLPVFYNKGGREVEAYGTRFSPKGCVIYTGTPQNCGTSFSLKISNPHTNKTIQVDSSVIMRKRFQNASKWGMMVRFINLTEADRDKVEQIVAQAATVSKPPSQSKYLKTPIGQAILRYFNLKKLIE
ncbi:MAG: PilZ domain-containing protein [Syntrophobacteria bacterium]